MVLLINQRRSLSSILKLPEQQLNANAMAALHILGERTRHRPLKLKDAHNYDYWILHYYGLAEQRLSFFGTGAEYTITLQGSWLLKKYDWGTFHSKQYHEEQKQRKKKANKKSKRLEVSKRGGFGSTASNGLSVGRGLWRIKLSNKSENTELSEYQPSDIIWNDYKVDLGNTSPSRLTRKIFNNCSI